jgi:hypothetical protein
VTRQATAAFLLLPLPLAAALSACAVRAAGPDLATLRLAAAQPAMRDAEDRPGVEQRRWVVQADTASLDAAISSFAVCDEEGKPTLDLLRGGLRFTVGCESRLPSLLESLGGSRTDLRVWHGQAAEWRELAGAAVPQQELLQIDGRMQPLPPGRLSLEFRGWLLPMEDGASCEIEVGVRWRGDARPAFREASAEDRRGRWLAGASLGHSLRRGEVLVLTAAAEGLPSDQGGLAAASAASPGGRLLAAHGENLHTLLILWPHLPEWMFPASAGSSPPD